MGVYVQQLRVARGAQNQSLMEEPLYHPFPVNIALQVIFHLKKSQMLVKIELEHANKI